MTSRLVPLNKNPEDVTTAPSGAQMGGRRSGSEAAIHAMRRMFQHENLELSFWLMLQMLSIT